MDGMIKDIDCVKNIMKEFSLSEENASNYVKKYWQKGC